MLNVHVVSCGTSVLSNLLARRKDWGGLEGQAERMKVSELAALLARDRSVRDEARRAAFADPFAFFAELNAMRPYLERREVDVAYPIGTRTAAASFSVDWLSIWLREQGVKVDTATAFEGYDRGSEGDEAERIAAFSADLQVLRARALRYVRARQQAGDRVLIAAQGGFKPEAGIMMIVAMETGATAYYVHEEMRQTVTLPVLAYRGSREGLAALRRRSGGRLAGDEAVLLCGMHPELLDEAEQAHAVVVRRDDDGRVRDLRLTDYGKLLVEEGA
jgi:putative CRISPR-associated protein (TIGR02619 family)